jgi:hypothetical protein
MLAIAIQFQSSYTLVHVRLNLNFHDIVLTSVGVLCLVISLSQQTIQAFAWVWGCLSPQSRRVDSRVVVGAVAQRSEHLRLKQEALSLIPLPVVL